MRLLIDMNLTPRWVSALIEAGHEAVHWSSLGPSCAPDSTICRYASDHGFVLITNDLDLPRILAYTSKAKPSVILLRGRATRPGTAGGSVDQSYQRMFGGAGRRGNSYGRLVGPPTRSLAAIDVASLRNTVTFDVIF